MLPSVGNRCLARTGLLLLRSPALTPLGKEKLRRRQRIHDNHTGSVALPPHNRLGAFASPHISMSIKGDHERPRRTRIIGQKWLANKLE